VQMREFVQSATAMAACLYPSRYALLPFLYSSHPHAAAADRAWLRLEHAQLTETVSFDSRSDRKSACQMMHDSHIMAPEAAIAEGVEMGLHERMMRSTQALLDDRASSCCPAPAHKTSEQGAVDQHRSPIAISADALSPATLDIGSGNRDTFHQRWRYCDLGIRVTQKGAHACRTLHTFFRVLARYA